MKHIDDNLTDLYLLSMLPEGVKLSIRNGRIVHEKPKSGEGVMSFVSQSFNSLRRWYNNDNRITAMNEIYDVIKTATRIMDECGDGKILERYSKIFPKVVQGIENYSRTYKDDAFIVSRCMIIVDNIKTRAEC